MKSIFVKPSSIEKREGERIIRIVDEKEIEFIDSYTSNGTMGFYIDTIEEFIEKKRVKKEFVVVDNAVSNNETKQNISLTTEQLQSYYNEYLMDEKEKETDILKLREVVKRMEHPKPSSFKNYCCNMFNIDIVSYPCEYCNVNNYPTIKSLSAHQRKCKLQYPKTPNNTQPVSPVVIKPIVVEVQPPVAETLEKPAAVSAKQKLLKKAL